MIIGKVCGTVHSTINHPFYDKRKLLVVDKIAPPGIKAEGYLIAVDSVDAGIGETVLVVDEGNGARQIVNDPDAPIRSIIVGIIDDIVIEQID
ncbi:MAG: EutN/CcmL family microcompartment protein [candidate division Zixibacteria bacterium]|nr:EutN/CcmL family microcompartment protein [candidate division Zixibacteria bacterium]